MSTSSNPAATKPEVAASYLGVQVPLSPFLTETRIERINAGQYERQEIDGALAVITAEDRVLELGAGLGIVGAVIAKVAQPQAMLSFEANPNLMTHIQKLYEMNGIAERVEVRNQVLVASPNRPATVDFHLGNSYLGSSLYHQPKRKQHKITIETADFEDIRTQFKPTVLVMDIEGGELELFEDADLTGIRAIIVEVHPSVYGPPGMWRCKEILQAHGFDQIEAHSNRTVWTCQRTDVTYKEIGATLLSEQGAETLLRLDEALVVPPTKNGFVQNTGVFDNQGEYCPQAELWRKGRAMTLRPEIPAKSTQSLAGRWLWGGVLWNHFGHFVVESTSRLWPLPQLLEEIDGVLFVPKRVQGKDELLKFQRELIDQIAPGIRIEIARELTVVDHLIVPEQGFGLGQITVGTEAFRKTMAQHFARDVAPKDDKKIYISRSGINMRRGGVVGEKRLDARLAAEGYTVLHPEKHSIETQLAYYKGAETVLCCEGSALHLFGMVARPDQKVGIVLRRKSAANKYLSRHLNSFTGNPPTQFDAIERSWSTSGNTRQHKWVGELDMRRLQGLLARAGFISSGGVPWTSASSDEIQAELGEDFAIVTI